jgi:hypothetical protein
MAESFSSPKAGGVEKKPKIERVAIIGSGIAGLSLAHALTNSPELAAGYNGNMEVSMFDSRESMNYEVGAGIQLNGGMAVLGKINRGVQQAVIDASVSISNLRARNKSWSGDSFDKMWDISVGDIVLKAGGATTEELVQDGKVLWYGIMRGALQVGKHPEMKYNQRRKTHTRALAETSLDYLIYTRKLW